MADYKEKIDEWQKTVRRKARELDEKYAISDLVDEGLARPAMLRNGALKPEFRSRKITRRSRTSGRAKATSARQRGGRPDEAVRGAEKAEGSSVTWRVTSASRPERKPAKCSTMPRLTTIVLRSSTTPARRSRALRQPRPEVLKAREWIKRILARRPLVSFSLVVGVRMGAALPGIDAVLLGAHPHWLTHSALPIFGARKLSEKFNDYLRKTGRTDCAGNWTKLNKNGSSLNAT